MHFMKTFPVHQDSSIIISESKPSKAQTPGPKVMHVLIIDHMVLMFSLKTLWSRMKMHIKTAKDL